MKVNFNSAGEVITVSASVAVGPFFYRGSLKFDPSGRLVVTG